MSEMGRVDLHYGSLSSLFWTALLLFKRETEIYSSTSDLTESKDFVAIELIDGTSFLALGIPERQPLCVELFFVVDFSALILHR
jgi:hypothetical protein